MGSEVKTAGAPHSTARGRPLVFGIRDPLPLSGFPIGRVRMKLRNDSFTTARVRTCDGIREYYLHEQDGCWQPAFESARNFGPTASLHPCRFVKAILDMQAAQRRKAASINWLERMKCMESPIGMIKICS